MALLIPNEAIASRWRGAREARLRQAPLEIFLRSRGEPYASGGASDLSKNIAAAVVLFATAGLTSYRKHQARALNETQHKLLARATCAMSEGLATLVQHPDAWRIAALVSTSRTLASLMTLERAAHFAAAAARDFSRDVETHEADVDDFGRTAAQAVRRNETARIDAVSALISRRLFRGYETHRSYGAVSTP
ncbi:MAG: hypothetical protein QOD56_1486 [Gammaproteobacteria bacterium]|jgi:hypothetical protein|nr:hypothetical protein [Gammaproteobacteria bacterium]